jgi:Tfp pilus assembly protein PilO
MMMMMMMMMHLYKHIVGKNQPVDKISQLKEELKKRFRQNRVDVVTAKENRETQFKPITQRLDKVQKVAKQTNDDLS